MFWMKAFALVWAAPDLTGADLVHPVDARRESPVDELVERYLDWREQCDALDSAYQGWAQATGLERDVAFALYRAALDREEKAARAYEQAAVRLEDSQRVG
jgi:hypothetical protein